jgi:hypothetical protein
MPMIEDKRLKITMLNGKIIEGYWYETLMEYPKIVPYEDHSLPIRITGLEVVLQVKTVRTWLDRRHDPTINSRFNNAANENVYVRRTIPMHEIDTIQMISEGGKRKTRRSKRSKRSKRSRRTRRK